MTAPHQGTAPELSTQPATKLDLVVITASTRPERFGHQVAGWFLDHLDGDPSFNVKHIDLTHLDVPAHIGAGALFTQASAELGAADGIVIVTPEYNHSYPGTLKNFIDHFRTEWAGRPIAFISYGGVSGGLRAIEHLRLVFAELRAATLRETVSFHSPHRAFTETGLPPDPGAARDAANRLLTEMKWWGTALAMARATRPYPGT